MSWKRGVLVVLLMLSSVLSFASSPVGKWTTIDDETGHKRALVEISEVNGVFSGTIIRVYPQPGDTGICHNCPGKFKGKPIQGLTFLWGLKDDGEGAWTGGEILDPKSGKIYRAKMSMKGNKLFVRGYLGFSFLGRTQTWVR